MPNNMIDADFVNNPETNNSITNPDDPYLSMSPTYLQQKNQSEVIKLLKTPESLQDFEYTLKGWTIDYQTQEHKKIMTPLMSEDGVNQLIPLVLSHCSNIVTMSIFTEQKVALLRFKAGVAVSDFLYHFSDAYNIKYENWNFIKTQVMILIDACLHRAKEGNMSDKNFLMTTERRIETINNNQGMGGGSFNRPRRFGGMFGNAMNFIRGES